MSAVDVNDMAFWFPPIRDAGLSVPRTVLVESHCDLELLLDGEEPEGFDEFLTGLTSAVNEFMGEPVFLRTGHGSGKHDWRDTCYVGPGDSIARHVGRLVEWSALAGFFGLPCKTWAVREFLETDPICCCNRYGGMPVAREFRFFVRDDEIEHIQPYWPHDAVAQGDPDRDGWEEDLARISRLGIEGGSLCNWARRAVKAVGGGYWSVDFLQSADRKWWLTDMADGDQSFRYEASA